MFAKWTSGHLRERFSANYYQRDRVTIRLTRNATQYLNEQFRDRWICRSGLQNWPPRSPDLIPLVFHVWGYTKSMVYVCKVDTIYELLQRIFDAARRVRNAAFLRKVTISMVKWVRMCIQTEGDHFEYFLNWTVQCYFQAISQIELYNIFLINKWFPRHVIFQIPISL